MKILFHTEAQKDIDESFDYYENQRDGLGLEFVFFVKEAIERIESYPESYSIYIKNIRKCLLKKFPYCIFYHLDKKKNLLFIIAVANFHKKPNFWIKRSP